MERAKGYDYGQGLQKGNGQSKGRPGICDLLKDKGAQTAASHKGGYRTAGRKGDMLPFPESKGTRDWQHSQAFGKIKEF